MSRDRNLVFAVNGQRFELSDVDPSTTVLEFLRLHTGFKSVKLGCGEGGCGACLVLLSRYDPASDRVEDYTVSSCLTLLCGIGGCSITTTEGLGNTKDGFHPIHKRFSGFHASQCGFCTPGMCISLYGALVNAEKTDRPEPTKGFSKLTVSEAERAISGNLCRCTGYRPIADACKSFAADVDIEDLGLNTFWRKGEDKEASLSRLPPYDQNTDIRGFPEFLKEEVKASDGLGVEKCNWYSPVTLDELQCLFGQDGMDKGHRVKLVVGNTSVGYYKENQRWDRYIDLRHIPELQVITKDKTGIEIGAAVTITKSIKELRDFSECLPNLDSEAVYVDDIPSPTNCLYGAFIYSTKPLARVKGIRFSPRLPKDAVISVVSFLDIPAGGENLGSRTVLGNEALFSDELAHCAGDRVAFVVAESQKNADLAAEAALIDYDTEDLEPPILSVEDAVERSSFFEVPSFLQPKQVGNFSEGMAEADHKILSARIQLGSQYYFYLENQSALAIPDEDNCMVIYSSMQCPEFLHGTVARCLGVPEHNIRVITRRVGGGFGGKSMRSMPVATACAVAAQKLNRPVRTYLNRKTDMILAGGRHPMKITYSVGFKSNGKITALHLDVLINAGLSADISPIVPQNIVGALKKYNWGSLSFEFKVCKTNHTSKSAMRAPGEVQGSFIAEVVIEHVASALLMEPDAIRNVNIHTYDSLSLFYGSNAAGAPKDYTGPSIWSKLDSSSDLARRAEEVKEFNIHNKWIKRGISRVPVVYEVTVRPTPGKVSVLSDGSVVVEVGGTELGQGLWTKVKQMVAFGLGLIQCDGPMELLEKVRVVQTDTLSVIQGGWTAGSTTSEANCQAVKLCCDTLVERLRPLRDSLREQMGSVTWEVLIEQAYLQFVSLSASAFYCPESILMRYLNYGAAVSEVEIDVLTGETTILRSDIIYDCGKSLNPAVDLGQIEGAFVQGIGFFMLEEYTTNSEGLVNTNGTWTYKIPTLDTIPRVFNVEVLSSGHHKGRVLSSKASGEPPLLLAASVHCATRTAIKEARRQLLSWSGMDTTDSPFQLDVPATLPIVKGLCGLDSIEGYLHWRMSGK
ncbi:hypothetical protein CRG98_006257 [Punica granatum]|uniref:indole-3-acetaldehyde oxidase n=1 Tax=Punica granatum TaxID=22663 RepID=A0A2I0KXW2_PUNGR|nr:hypothetical protein CRG98_006257 [Punica granatum]